MSSAEIVLALIKILILLLFFLNMAALGPWADRRQSAMIQDRVGPNRAVAYLPSNVARVIVLLPPSILGGIALLPLLRGVKPPAAHELLPINAHLAVLVTWISLLVLSGVVRKEGPLNKAEEALSSVDPRTIFYAGVAGHAIAVAALSTVPREDAAVVLAAQITGALLAGLFFLCGI
jgi:NADH-quinone oxidoreductase subunit H